MGMQKDMWEGLAEAGCDVRKNRTSEAWLRKAPTTSVFRQCALAYSVQPWPKRDKCNAGDEVFRHPVAAQSSNA